MGILLMPLTLVVAWVLGIGIAGIVTSSMDQNAWTVVTIVVSTFLLGAAGNHVKEMITDKNCAPGNSLVLLHDIGLPASLVGLLLVM